MTDQLPSLPGITTSDWGALFAEDVDWEDFEALVTSSAIALRRHTLILGDSILYYHEHREWEWGHKYDQLIALTGLSYNRLANAASIARVVPTAQRKPTWQHIHTSHFRAVRSLPTVTERIAALDHANDQLLNYEELQGYVRDLKGEPIPPRKLHISIEYSFDAAGRKRLAQALYEATDGDPDVPEAIQELWNAHLPFS